MNVAELTESHIQEAFDTKPNKYEAVNLNPKDSVPQLFLIKVPGNDNLVVRIASGKSLGSSVKKLTMSDDIMQVYVISISTAGNEVKLKGGLGSDPIGALSTIFDVVFDTAKKIKANLVMFRLIKSQMKGKEGIVQNIIGRLINSRTGGKYTSVPDIQDQGKKFAYILAKSKRVSFEDIKSMPEIDSKQFKTTTTDVGDVFINNKTGKQVSKDEVYSKTLADSAEETNPQTILSTTKISRKALLSAQSVTTSDDTVQSMHTTAPVYATDENEPVPYVFGSKIEETIKTIAGNTSFSAEDAESLKGSMHYYVRTNGRDHDGTLYDLFVDHLSSVSDPSMRNLLAGLYNNKMTDAQGMIAVEKVIKIFKLRDQYIAGKVSAQAAIREALAVSEFTDKRLIAAVVKTFNNIDISAGYWQVFGEYKPTSYTPEQTKAIKSYTELGFQNINGALLGMKKLTSAAKEEIEALDSAFANGIKLPKGTVVYRGQALGKDVLSKSIENKIFYFANFVSCSLLPIIYSGMYVDSTDLASIDPLDPEEVSADNYEKNYFKIAWVISGADKIRTIIPGKISSFNEEVEVILPRGTAVSIKSVTIDGDKVMIDASVVDPSLLENENIYDGDTLINEGKIKPLDGKIGFRSFIKEAKDQYQDDTYINEQLLSVINFDAIPEKFMQ